MNNTLRELIKGSSRFICGKRPNRTVRKFREWWYKHLDSGGEIIFSILRSIYLLPPLERYVPKKVAAAGRKKFKDKC